MTNGQDTTQGNGQAEQFDFPMGINPYFDEAEPEQQETAPEDGAALDAPASDDGQQDDYQQAQGEPEPTFDTEQDAAAGIDVNSPEYKHFQAAFTRHTQRRTQAPVQQSDEFDDLRRENTARRIEQETTASQGDGEIPTYDVTFEDFQAPQLAPDSPLSGYEDSVLKIVVPAIKHMLSKVNEQGSQYVQQQRTQKTHAYLTQVIDAIGQQGGESAKAQAFSLLREYAPIAQKDPVKWARFAATTLGLVDAKGNVVQKQSTQRQGNPNRIAQQVRGQSTRPSAPSRTPAPKPKFQGKDGTRAAVAWALEQQLRGR